MVENELNDVSRVLIEAILRPVQGERFQPTGFPNLGAAEYKAPDGTEMLLVESAQSMANRLEAVCWDEGANDVIAQLRGLPYVKATLPNGRTTNSLLEAHRLNSPYFFSTKRGDAKPLIDELEKLKSDASNQRELASLAFKYDPNSVVHGVFLEKIAGGLRLKRALSAFIEAREIRVADSGGVKMDVVDPEGKIGAADGKKGSSGGFGHVPFHRREFTAKVIRAYFNVDLALIRSYGLGPDAEELLTVLSMYKIRRFLDKGLRLRTACDLECADMKVTAPAGWVLPSLSELEAALPKLIAACKPRFADPLITSVKWEPSKASKAKGAEESKDEEEE